MRSPEDGIWLAPIDARRSADGLLELTIDDYLTMLDLSGRLVREGKAGAIPDGLPPMFERLGIDPGRWRTAIHRDMGGPGSVIGGSALQLAEEATRRGRNYILTIVESPVRVTSLE